MKKSKLSLRKLSLTKAKLIDLNGDMVKQINGGATVATGCGCQSYPNDPYRACNDSLGCAPITIGGC